MSAETLYLVLAGFLVAVAFHVAGVPDLNTFLVTLIVGACWELWEWFTPDQHEANWGGFLAIALGGGLGVLTMKVFT